MDLKACEYRGASVRDSCFCKHPANTGPNMKSKAVPRTQCEHCPLMQAGGTTVQLVVDEGPGTELQKRFARHGFPSCQQCYLLAQRMNRWGPEECRTRIEEIVADILPRAEKWVASSQPWALSLFGQRTTAAALLKLIRREVNKAIKAYEETQRQQGYAS